MCTLRGFAAICLAAGCGSVSAAPALAAEAAASESKRCGNVVAEGGAPPDSPLEPHRWSVRGHAVGCRAARKVARRHLRSGRDWSPGNWSCDADPTAIACWRGNSSVLIKNRGPLGRKCGTLIFTPYSDHAASGIQAHRTSCRQARRLARRIDRGRNLPAGWRCSGTSHDPPSGLAYTHYACRKGKQRARWIAT